MNSEIHGASSPTNVTLKSINYEGLASKLAKGLVCKDGIAELCINEKAEQDINGLSRHIVQV